MYVCMYVCMYVHMYVSNPILRCVFAKEARLIRSLSSQPEKEAVYENAELDQCYASHK